MNAPLSPDTPGRDAASDEPALFNPYVASAQAPTSTPDTHDLDGAAPNLTPFEARRLNRRALGLAASIVAMLGTVGAWMIYKPDAPVAPARPREEVVSVPKAMIGGNERIALPTPTPSAAQPIALRATAPSPYMSGDFLGEPESVAPREPTLVERRIAAASQGTTGVADGVSVAPAAPPGYPPYLLDPSAAPAGPTLSATGNLAYTAKDLANVSSATPLVRPDTLMLRGTVIRCTLETRIVTDIPGFTSCSVTEPIYSFTGKRLLLPKGSKVQGKYAMEPNGPRVAVIWDRIVTPTGIDVNMASPGIDTLGGAGHPGHYSAHWGSRIGSALMLSLFSDAFKYAAAKHGPVQTEISNGVITQSPFESNTAETIQSLARSAIARSANRPATVTIHQGAVLAIYVARDVDFSGVLARY